MRSPKVKRRARIHPAIACTAIIALVVLCVSAELHSSEPLVSFKLAITAIIAAIAGIKVRHVLPVT